MRAINVRTLSRAIRAGWPLAVFITSAVAGAQSGWTNLPLKLSGSDLNAVYFADSKRGWVGGDEGFLSRTEDGGRSWVQQRLETRDAINDIFFRNKDDGFLLAGGRVFGSEDGGLSWKELRRFSAPELKGAQVELYSVRFRDKKKGWVVGSLSRNTRGAESVIDSLIYKTTDGGLSWGRQTAPTREELIHLDFVSEKRGWIVGSGGTILYTTDGGDTWQTQRARTKATLYHVDFRNEKRGWAVGEKGTILRTEDGGTTWISVNSPVRGTLLSVQFANDDEGWIVGRGGVILRSGDKGLTWVQQDANTKQNLYALYVEKNNGWVVGGDGLILRYER
jgi:photosystem II stability/assembly factor-like uncharacterized protein